MTEETQIEALCPRLLCVGIASAVFDRVAMEFSSKALIERISWEEASRIGEGSLQANLLLLAPPIPPPCELENVAVEEALEVLDNAFLVSTHLVKLLASNQSPFRRVVFLVDLSIYGLSQDSVAALVAGGITGLARSWAAELDEEGITVNVIVISAADEPDIIEGAAHAVNFFLAPAAASISGQILTVARSQTIGTLPI